MNKIIISLIAVTITIASLAQAQVNNDIDSLIDISQNRQNFEAPIYQLFPTQNIRHIAGF